MKVSLKNFYRQGKKNLFFLSPYDIISISSITPKNNLFLLYIFWGRFVVENSRSLYVYILYICILSFSLSLRVSFSFVTFPLPFPPLIACRRSSSSFLSSSTFSSPFFLSLPNNQPNLFYSFFPSTPSDEYNGEHHPLCVCPLAR